MNMKTIKKDVSQYVQNKINEIQSSLNEISSDLDQLIIDRERLAKELAVYKGFLEVEGVHTESNPSDVAPTPPLRRRSGKKAIYELAHEVLKESTNGLTSRELIEGIHTKGRDLGKNALTLLGQALRNHSELFSKKGNLWFVKE